MSNCKKGTTLIELVIVLAIVSIMSVMVTSFSLAVNSWLTLGTERNKMLMSDELVMNKLEDFIENFDRAEYRFYVEDGKLFAKEHEINDSKLVLSNMGDSEYCIYYHENTLKIKGFNFEEFANNKDNDLDKTDFEYSNDVPLENIENVHFYVDTKDDGSQLIICRVFYYFPVKSKSNLNNSGVKIHVFTTKATKLVETVANNVND